MDARGQDTCGTSRPAGADVDPKAPEKATSSPTVTSQDYLDWEVGLTHQFPSGLFLGGSARLFDYEDVNESLDNMADSHGPCRLPVLAEGVTY